MSSDQAAYDARSLAIDQACTEWQAVAQIPKVTSAELVVPASLLTRDGAERSSWSRMATRGSNAPLVYLGLLGLAQLILRANEEARYDEQRHEWKAIKLRGSHSLEAFMGFRGSQGHEAMSVAMRRLLAVGLVRLPRAGARGFAQWKRFDILNPDRSPFVVPRSWVRKPDGYNKPLFVGVPIGFWTNGWFLDLAVKETEALLALLYERERTPTREAGRGWFVSAEQRRLLCLDSKTFGAHHRLLSDRGVLTPVDPDGYQESKLRRGRGPKTDRPHEFMINFDVFNGRCVSPSS